MPILTMKNNKLNIETIEKEMEKNMKEPAKATYI